MRARRGAPADRFHALTGGQLPKLLFCFIPGLAGGLLASGGEQRDMHVFGVRKDCSDDLNLQGGKIGEAVEKDLASIQKLRLVQKFTQAHLPRDRIAASCLADGQVAFI